MHGSIKSKLEDNIYHKGVSERDSLSINRWAHDNWRFFQVPQIIEFWQKYYWHFKLAHLKDHIVVCFNTTPHRELGLSFWYHHQIRFTLNSLGLYNNNSANAQAITWKSWYNSGKMYWHLYRAIAGHTKLRQKMIADKLGHHPGSGP